MFSIDEIKTEYPDVYDAIFEEGKKAGLKEANEEAFANGETAGYEKGKAEGLKEGAETERKRIQEVEAQALPGHEALIEELKYDGKTTGGEAAVQVLQAENVKREVVKVQLDEDAPDPVDPANPPEIEGSEKADDDLPPEEKAKAKWDKDSELRAEFMDDFESYLAYVKADEDGRVRILKSGKNE